MKKIISLVIAIVLLTACVLSVNAATGITADEQKIIDALSKKVTMASGAVAELPASYINTAKDYLIKADLSAQDVQGILTSIDAAAKVVEESKAESLGKMDKADKIAFIDSAKDAAEVIDAELIIKKGDKVDNWNLTLKFTEESNVPGYTATDKPVEINISGGDIIKQTGVEGNMVSVIVAASVVMMGLAFVVISARKKASDR